MLAWASMRASAKIEDGKSSSGKNHSKSSRDKLALSRGSDDTESLGKDSNSLEEIIEKSREKKRAVANERRSTEVEVVLDSVRSIRCCQGAFRSPKEG